MDGGLREEGRIDRDRGREAVKEGGSETARTKQEGKERGRDAWWRKRGSTPRTKMKSRGCHSSDLKTILYS